METTTTSTPSTARIALRYGLIFGFVAVIYQLILYVAQLELNTLLGLLQFVILITGIVLAMKYFRTENGNYMTYGQGLGLGSLTAAVFGMIYGLFVTIYQFYIDPSLRTRQIEYTQEMLENLNQPDSVIDQAVERLEAVGPGQTFLSGIFTYLIIGFILSLIIAAIMKKDRDVLDTN